MRKLMMAALLALPMFGAAVAQETLKIAWIDPLSGGAASNGERALKVFQFLANELNAKGGVLGKQVEIVPFDNKLNPQESLIQAQKAIDAGIRILTQGQASSVAGALTDFVTKPYKPCVTYLFSVMIRDGVISLGWTELFYGMEFAEEDVWCEKRLINQLSPNCLKRP